MQHYYDNITDTDANGNARDDVTVLAPEQRELLRQCRDSGQMSAKQEYAHEQAGDFDEPAKEQP